MPSRPAICPIPSELPSMQRPVEISLNEAPLEVFPASSVAAALLAAGIHRFRRSQISGVARAPYCMMGTCFECLIEIDGVPNRQACLEPLRAGMRIRVDEICTSSTAVKACPLTPLPPQGTKNGV